jgi:hypothetical protein
LMNWATTAACYPYNYYPPPIRTIDISGDFKIF